MNDMYHDELSTVRRARERVGTVEPTDDDLARGLARFERDLAHRSPSAVKPARRARGRSRRRGFTWAGIGVVAVGALAGVTLVATPSLVIAPIVPADTSAEAAELLGRAADQVLAADAQLQPGQYMRVASRSEGLSSLWYSWDVKEGEATALNRELTENAMYLPADPTAPVRIRQSDAFGRQLVYPLGGDAERLVREEFDITEDPSVGPLAEPAPGAVNDDAWPRGVEAGRATAPTDAEGLREYLLDEWDARDLEDDPETAETSDTYKITFGAWSIVDDQSLPSELRAAAYRLLATDSELKVTYFPGYDASQDWSSPRESTISIGAGTSVSIHILPDVATQLIFDEATGRLIGRRDLLERPSRE